MCEEILQYLSTSFVKFIFCVHENDEHVSNIFHTLIGWACL